MKTTRVTVTETVEVEHFNISLSTAEVKWLENILCDWVDGEDTYVEVDGVPQPSPDSHHEFAHKLSYEVCQYLWGHR